MKHLIAALSLIVFSCYVCEAGKPKSMYQIYKYMAKNSNKNRN